MKPTDFALDHLAKPRVADRAKRIAAPSKGAASKRPAVKVAASSQKFPKMSPWGKELMKRLDKLHRIMDEEGFKFSQT